jgi:ribonucleoside-diphosphate reductase alpha chain
MTNGTAIASRSTNGFARKTDLMSPEQIADGWMCKKRNGAKVAFDCEKMRRALWKCFHAITKPAEDQTQKDVDDATAVVIREVVKAVVNSIEAEHKTEVEVEHVQRLIVAQLFAKGLYEAGEHYQNYREEHRKKRLVKPISAEVQARFDEMRKHFPTDLQAYQFMSKFSKWNDTEKRRETWKETVYDRVLPWLLKQAPQGALTADEIRELHVAMYALEALPAMRVTQMAGPALDRCNVGAYNCAYAPVDEIFAFPEALYILMQGTGHGFSVESDYISELPRVKKQKAGAKPDTLVVDDSTEGWCDAYHGLLTRLWDGHDAFLDTSGVRKANTRLKTKGGRASGPEPLLELAAFARNVIKAKQGKYLDDTDAHRLMCFTGRIVQVGGVRRAATLSLSDLDSLGMRHIKSGAWWAKDAFWEDGRYLSMANNSAVYEFDEDVPVETFMDEWLSLVKSHSGERGIFNRKAALRHSPKRRKWGRQKPGCNPCAEILLRPKQFCNLSIAVARPRDTEETLTRKVRLAAYFGKLQSLATKFNYIRPEWQKNCEEERLLGVDITGHADCPLLRFDTPDRSALLRRLARVVEEVDIDLSARFGCNRSAANTTVKPSGDSAVFLDCASGVSARFAQHQIRWVREPKDSPVAKYLVEAGVKHAPAPEAKDRLLVFAFPKKAPEGCTLRNDMTAEQQFYNWLDWKKNWAEHSVSATIYVEPKEWPRLGMLVYENIEHITGLSFLDKDNGSYTYAPNEEITKEEFEKMEAEFPVLNWAKVTEYETDDETTSRQTMACVGQGCES